MSKFASIPLEVFHSICTMIVQDMGEDSHVFNLRLTCKRWNIVLQPMLFRQVNLRINIWKQAVTPDLRSLASRETGICNATTSLTIHPLDLAGVVRLKAARLLLSPHPLGSSAPIGIEKYDEFRFQRLVSDIKKYLTPAIFVMDNLTHVKWFIGGEILNWVQKAVVDGFSSKNIQELELFISPHSELLVPINVFGLTKLTIHGVCSQTSARHVSNLIMNSPNLTALELRTTSLVFQDSFNHFQEVWEFLNKSHIHLTLLSVDFVSISLLEYLASFRGLKSLSLSCDYAHTYEQPEAKMIASHLFLSALPRHYETLHTLQLPFPHEANNIWSLGNDFILPIQHCVHLKSLSIGLHVQRLANTSFTREFLNSLKTICSLPMLCDLSITLRIPTKRSSTRYEEIIQGFMVVGVHAAKPFECNPSKIVVHIGRKGHVYLLRTYSDCSVGYWRT